MKSLRTSIEQILLALNCGDEAKTNAMMSQLKNLVHHAMIANNMFKSPHEHDKYLHCNCLIIALYVGIYMKDEAGNYVDLSMSNEGMDDRGKLKTQNGKSSVLDTRVSNLLA